MTCLILQGDEQTAAVAGFVNIEYHFLHFVLILTDGRHLPFFLRSLTLPARPRLNDFRWALLRTEIAQAPYNAQLRRFCRFGYTIVNNSLTDRRPYVKQLQDDACLRNLLRLHTQGTCQATFYLEQCQASKWIPKNLTHSLPNKGGDEKLATLFDFNPPSVDSSSSNLTSNSIEKHETQQTVLSSWSSTPSEIHHQTSFQAPFDGTDSESHHSFDSGSLPISVQEENCRTSHWSTVSSAYFTNPYSTRFWAGASSDSLPCLEYFSPYCFYIPSYIQCPWFISQRQPGFS